MLTLEAKHIGYTARLLQGSQSEHKQPDFLALNPRGKVPVLRDGEGLVGWDRHHGGRLPGYERTYPPHWRQ